MFGCSDLVTICVLENQLSILRKYPNRLNFILSPFSKYERIRTKVGAQYIDQVVKFILNNEISIIPAYLPGVPKGPSIYVLSQTGEGQQFLGDYGNITESAVYDPIVYSEFDAVSIVDDVISVSYDAHIESKVWTGVILTNGTTSAFLESIGPVRAGSNTELYLDRDLPVGTRLSGWKAQSHAVRTNFEVHGDIEDVRVQAILRTSGDPSVHRVLSSVIRMCLKAGRPEFDAFGMQTSTFSQGFMTPIESEGGLICETTYNITAKFPEFWVAAETTADDDTGNIEVTITASPPADAVIEEDVVLETTTE